MVFKAIWDSKTDRWFFLFLLSIFLILGSFATIKAGPFFLADTLDPDYAYLFNGLNIASGKAPTHVDHPGTTLQSLLAAGIFVSSLFQEKNKIQFTIEHAETILLFFNVLFIFVIAILCSLIAIEMKKRISLPWVFLFLSTAFTNYEILRSFSRVSPEPMLVICCLATTLLAIQFLNNLDDEQKMQSNRFWMSIWLAAGLITKITFLPLMFFLGLQYGDKKNLKSAAKTFFLFAFVFFLPASGSFRSIMHWFGDIISHTGSYGSGEVGVVSSSRLYSAITLLVNQQIFLVAALLCGAYLIFQNRKVINSFQYKSCLIMLAVFGLQLLMFTKHPGTRYLLPSLVLMPFFLYLLFSSIQLKPVFKTFFVLLFAVQLIESVKVIDGFLNRTQDYRQAAQYPLSNRDFLICSYPCSRSVFGLNFGNVFSGKDYSNELFAVYPHFFEFGIVSEDHKLYDFNKKTFTLDELFLLSDKIYVQGPTETVEARLPTLPEIEVTTIVKNSTEALYMMRKK